MLYKIKPEYLERWGSVATTDDVITPEQLVCLASSWGVLVTDLLKQVEPTDEYVVNQWGVIIRYNVAEALMDEMLMNTLHNELAPCSNQFFFYAYAHSHKLRFGETWELDKLNPVY